MKNQKEIRRRQRKARNDMGLCINCPNPLGRSKSMCDACLIKMKVNNDKRIAYRKANKLCVRCGKPTVDGYNECQIHLEDQKIRRKRRINIGNCAYCGKPANGKTICDYCSQKRAIDREERKAAKLCVTIGCCNDAREGKVTCVECANRTRDKTRKLKQIVLNHYGQICNCVYKCGVTNFKHLTIDHKNNDGAEQRKKGNHHCGQAEYRRIIKAGFPNDLQVLCWNCNCAKEYYGGCND